MTTPADQLRAAMHLAGLDCGGQIMADGRLHRFKAEGDHARNSWYVLHPGPPAAGAFGCWKRGISQPWCDRNGNLSERDRQTVRKQWQAADAERKRAERERRHRARKVAAWIYDRAKPLSAHPYLATKRIGVHGELRERHGALVLPLRDTGGQLHSLQRITPDGTKLYLEGGRIKGCYFTLADKPDGPLAIAEGYATAASVHEATGYATVAAMNCGNLLEVAKALRDKWPKREFVLAADNDQWTDGNPGLTKATEAANMIRARLAVPCFEDTTSRPTDFNDLQQLEGLDTVRQQIQKADTPKETHEQAYERLANLSAADYDQSRKAEARCLGVRTSTLDHEVETRRPKTTTANSALQGCAVLLPDVEPWPDSVDGAEVLAAVAAVFSHYLALPPGAADALALWTAHAHCFTAFDHTPRINACSPDKGCGKTTLLDVLASMTPRPLRTESMTAAVLFRLVESCKPTLLLDEVDAYLSEAEELRGLLNAGHKRGARAYRCEGDSNTVRGFNAFAPAALAGIGHLPGTLHDRSIVLRLVRAKPGELAARFDSRHTERETGLCRKLARWTADNLTRLEACDPALPSNAFNRLADNWRPLFAIAEVAGADLPARAAAAYAALTTTEDTDAQGIGTILLTDIAEIFAAEGTDRLPSEKLAAALSHMEGRPWPEFGKARKPISANQLANQLRRFDIAPRVIRIGAETPRGYDLADFQDAFDRFLPKPPPARVQQCNNP